MTSSFRTSITQDELERLIDLFPLSAIRTVWKDDFKARTKADLCAEVAQKASLDAIIAFAESYLAQCRQHVYVFAREEGAMLPAGIVDGERVRISETRALYLTRIVSRVFVPSDGDTATTQTITFLRPVVVELRPAHVLVRLVTLEKALPTYFTSKVYVQDRGIDEDAIIGNLVPDLSPADLHRGIKALWADDTIDSHYCSVVNTDRTTTEKMHERKGLKATRPDLYEEMITKPLERTIFDMLERDKGEVRIVQTFSIEPGRGFLSFMKYSNGPGGTNGVIYAVLDKN